MQTKFWSLDTDSNVTSQFIFNISAWDQISDHQFEYSVFNMKDTILQALLCSLYKDRIWRKKGIHNENLIIASHIRIQFHIALTRWDKPQNEFTSWKRRNTRKYHNSNSENKLKPDQDWFHKTLPDIIPIGFKRIWLRPNFHELHLLPCRKDLLKS